MYKLMLPITAIKNFFFIITFIHLASCERSKKELYNSHTALIGFGRLGMVYSIHLPYSIAIHSVMQEFLLFLWIKDDLIKNHWIQFCFHDFTIHIYTHLLQTISNCVKYLSWVQLLLKFFFFFVKNYVNYSGDFLFLHLIRYLWWMLKKLLPSIHTLLLWNVVAKKCHDDLNSLCSIIYMQSVAVVFSQQNID